MCNMLLESGVRVVSRRGVLSRDGGLKRGVDYGSACLFRRKDEKQLIYSSDDENLLKTHKEGRMVTISHPL